MARIPPVQVRIIGESRGIDFTASTSSTIQSRKVGTFGVTEPTNLPMALKESRISGVKCHRCYAENCIPFVVVSKIKNQDMFFILLDFRDILMKFFSCQKFRGKRYIEIGGVESIGDKLRWVMCGSWSVCSPFLLQSAF